MSWIEANGASLRFQFRNSGRHVLVLIHEAGGSLESWNALLPLLPATCSLLSYDQRGFGMSERARSLSLDGMVADLHALIAGLGRAESPLHLLGTAIGGSIALAYAGTHGDRVRSVIATSPVTGGLETTARQLLADRACKVEREGMRSIADASLARSFPEELRAAVGFGQYRARFLGNDPESFAALTRCYEGISMDPYIPRLAARTLVVGCRRDSIKPAHECAELAALLPRGHYVELDSGHFVSMQHPALLAAAATRFVGDLA